MAAPSVGVSDIKALVQLSKDRPRRELQHRRLRPAAAPRGRGDRAAHGREGHPHHLQGRRPGDDRPRHRAGRLRQLRGRHGNPFLQDGKLKPLAVVQDQRSSLVPEVTTTAEQGLPGLNAGVHFMLFAPAGTPKGMSSPFSMARCARRWATRRAGAPLEDRLRSDAQHGGGAHRHRAPDRRGLGAADPSASTSSSTDRAAILSLGRQDRFGPQ